MTVKLLNKQKRLLEEKRKREEEEANRNDEEPPTPEPEEPMPHPSPTHKVENSQNSKPPPYPYFGIRRRNLALQNIQGGRLTVNVSSSSYGFSPIGLRYIVVFLIGHAYLGIVV